MATREQRDAATRRNGNGHTAAPRALLNDLGEKIFLDRYALKDMTKKSLAEGDTVIVCVNQKTRQREIGTVRSLSNGRVNVELRDGTVTEQGIEDVDKPLETDPGQMMDRVARGIAAIETAAEKQKEWEANFRWLLDDWKFVPGGRILTAAGTDQQLTFFNCYVVSSPKDSRRGIVDTLSQMMEIMSRGGGVGINLSSLRPRHAYVKGVNGRSSGSVSWGGLYSFVTGLIEQGGCLTPDTLVFTEKGLLRLDEIVGHPEPGWREQQLAVMTDEGVRLSRQVFNNGAAHVLTVRTDAGITITGTPNHKVKVMTSSGPQWRRLDELQARDAILIKLGQHRGSLQMLRKPDLVHHNQDRVELPDVLDEELAFFLGYMAGDGFMTTKDNDWRLGVAVAHDSYLIDEMPQLMGRLFKGTNVRIQQKADDASLCYLISNRAVKEFLHLNGFDKVGSTAVAVPRLIRQSPPEVVGAFLRGLFEADGSPSHGYPSLMSTSKRLIDEVATLLLGLGCPVKIGRRLASENHYGSQPVWRLRIQSFVGLANWRSKIGCDPRSRFAFCLEFEPDLTREVSYRLPNAQYWIEPVLAATALPQIDRRATGEHIDSTDPVLRRKLLRYTRGERNLTMSAYSELGAAHPAFATHAAPVDDLWFASVEQVEPAGRSLTLDLEVDGNHTYLANGLVTHNSRRGALMLILNVWHPDVLSFINSKREMGKITNANISIGLTDAFMEAVHADADWELVFPDPQTPGYDEDWDGDLEKWRAAGKPVNVHKTVKAREIWNSIVESAWASAEPGLWFIDRANKMSNSWYFSPLICTNPCGEQPLPAWGICNLGAINLSRFAHDGAVLWDDLRQAVRYAVRFLDNVIDATPYFFEENKQQQQDERRIGLGIMGLADMLIRLRIRYGSEECIKFLDQLGEVIATEAYQASAGNAAEKGSFPKFDAEKLLQSGYMQAMPEQVRELVRREGLRNVTLLTVAPTGTTGTMVATSTGVEPYFSWSYFRKSRLGVHEERVAIVEEWEQANPGQPLPDYFVNAMELTPIEHVNVQAAIQRWIDSAISKTCNVPSEYTVEQTRELYEYMYRLGCKGGTIYRDGSRDEQVLNLKKDDEKAKGNGTAATSGTTTAPAIAAPVASEAKPEDESAKNPLSALWNKPKVRPRPKMARGMTIKKESPLGSLYVTINNDDEGEPLEIFVTAGKAGSDVTSMADALGRLASLVLRVASPVTPHERLQEIVAQLKGIGGARSTGFGPNRVRSLPDAVARAIEECYTSRDSTAVETSLPDGHVQVQLPLPSVRADLCPECGEGAFVHEEGCMHCNACGFSQC